LLSDIAVNVQMDPTGRDLNGDRSMSMKTIFGALALLVALSFIGTVGKKQAHVLNNGTVTTRASTAATPP
jgi:hypothetical protein